MDLTFYVSNDQFKCFLVIQQNSSRRFQLSTNFPVKRRTGSFGCERFTCRNMKVLRINTSITQGDAAELFYGKHRVISTTIEVESYKEVIERVVLASSNKIEKLYHCLDNDVVDCLDDVQVTCIGEKS